MKKPVVDYTKLRPGNIRSREYRHVILLVGWVVYFAMYFITENLIPESACHLVHCHLDDVIPFNEYFLIFYCLWYALVFGSLLYFLLYDIESFTNVQIFIMVTQFIAMVIYVFWPNRQDLRPEVFQHDNFLTHLMAFIYKFDTPTGVCPSLHVGYSMGILSIWMKKKDCPVWIKVLIAFLVVMICISVAFVKQHSVVDILAAMPVSLAAEFYVYFPRLRAWRAKRYIYGQ